MKSVVKESRAEYFATEPNPVIVAMAKEKADQGPFSATGGYAVHPRLSKGSHDSRRTSVTAGRRRSSLTHSTHSNPLLSPRTAHAAEMEVELQTHLAVAPILIRCAVETFMGSRARLKDHEKLHHSNAKIYVEILRLFSCLVHSLDIENPIELEGGEVREPKYLCNHILLNDSVLHRVVTLLDTDAHTSPVATPVKAHGDSFPGLTSHGPAADGICGDVEEEAYNTLVHDLGVTLTRKVTHKHTRENVALRTHTRGHATIDEWRIPVYAELGHRVLRGQYGKQEALDRLKEKRKSTVGGKGSKAAPRAILRERNGVGSPGRRFSQLDVTSLTRMVDERCVFFIHQCLVKPDEAQVALRLFRVGAIHGLAQVVRRYARSVDKLAYNHAINCLVVFAKLHSGKYHPAIIDEGAAVLMELRLKMKELESYSKKRHSTNYAEQSVIEMLHKLMVAAKKRQETAY